MATFWPPKRATAYIIYIALESVATAGTFQSNPTIAAGDFKVSLDGGALANLTTLPTVTPASGKMVKISLSSAEMTADNVTIVCSDAAGNEWKDLVISLATVTNQNDDLATPTNITAGTITTATNVTTVNGLASGVITATSIAADAITAAKIADGAIDAATFAAGAINAAAIAANAITAANVATDAIGAAQLALDAVTEIQSGLGTSANQTTIINALTTIASYIDTEVAAIKAKTDNLPPDPADASDIVASFSAITTSLSTIASYIDTEVAAIKAKTDNLPTDPADASDIAAALAAITGYIDTEVATLIANVASILGQTSTTGVALSTATKQAIADEVLKRAGSNVDDTAGTFSLYEMIMALLNSSMAGGTWTIKKSTGATFATRALTTDTNAEPVIAVG